MLATSAIVLDDDLLLFRICFNGCSSGHNFYNTSTRPSLELVCDPIIAEHGEPDPLSDERKYGASKTDCDRMLTCDTTSGIEKATSLVLLNAVYTRKTRKV